MAQARDQSETVKHLRFIHFLLTITTAGMLVASWLNRDDAIETAYDDIQRILNLQSEWRRDPHWIDRFAEEQIKPHLQEYELLTTSLDSIGSKASENCHSHNLMGSFPLIIEYSDKNKKTVACVHGRIWTLRGPIRLPRENRAEGAQTISKERLELAPPEHLDEFIKVWDWLHSKDYVFILGRALKPVIIDEVFWIDEMFTSDSYRLGIEPIRFHSRTMSEGVLFRLKHQYNGSSPLVVLDVHRVLQLYPVPSKSTQNDIDNHKDIGVGSTHALEGNLSVTVTFDNRRKEIEIPIRIELITHLVRFNPLSKMSDLANADWRIGQFQDSFPELYDITKSFPSARLDHIEAIVGRIRSESRGKIDVIGIQFPTAIVSSVGVLAIVIIQLYFSLHFHEFAKHAREHVVVNDVPWVGLYNGLLPQSVTAITIIALPPTGIIGLIVMHIIESSRYDLSFWVVAISGLLGVLLSFLLARRIVRDFGRLSKHIEQNKGQ